MSPGRGWVALYIYGPLVVRRETEQRRGHTTRNPKKVKGELRDNVFCGLGESTLRVDDCNVSVACGKDADRVCNVQVSVCKQNAIIIVHA